MTSESQVMRAGPGISPRSAARIAGYGYLAIFVLALFANFFVIERLIEPEDAATTADNILGSESLFRAGLVAFVLVFALDVVVAWALYLLFRPANKDLSLLTAWFRLVYTILLGIGAVGLFTVLRLTSGSDYLAAFTTGQLDAHVTLSLEAFDYAWLIGLACFGVHLFLLGVLGLRSGAVPRTLALLLMVAGAAYVADTLAHALLANYADYENVFLVLVATPSLIAELWFTLWLLLSGGKDRPTVLTGPGGQQTSPVEALTP